MEIKSEIKKICGGCYLFTGSLTFIHYFHTITHNNHLFVNIIEKKMSKKILQKTCEALSRAVKCMFDCECWTEFDEIQANTYPDIDDFMVYLPISGENKKECHLLLGFPAELVNALIGKVLKIDLESHEYHKIMESTVGEIANLIASQIVTDEEMIALIGKCRINPPLICDLIEKQEISIPFELGEKIHADIGRFRIDIFMSFVDKSQIPGIIVSDYD